MFLYVLNFSLCVNTYQLIIYFSYNILIFFIKKGENRSTKIYANYFYVFNWDQFKKINNFIDGYLKDEEIIHGCLPISQKIFSE